MHFVLTLSSYKPIREAKIIPERTMERDTPLHTQRQVSFPPHADLPRLPERGRIQTQVANSCPRTSGLAAPSPRCASDTEILSPEVTAPVGPNKF